MEFILSVQDLLESAPHPAKRLPYGTAGFRDKAENMPCAVTRAGLFACLLSHSSASQCVGLMITASHNAEEDNGVKIADVDGGMLEQSWEKSVEDIANSTEPLEAMNLIQELIANHKISLNTPAHVVVGRDTRPSSFSLFECACRGIEAFGGTVHDIGTVTTPQLHFVVKRLNEDMKSNPGSFPRAMDALELYYSRMCHGYFELRSTAEYSHNDSIIIDAANGIGGRSVSVLSNVMLGLYPDALDIDIRNDVGSGPVNEGCGAELVQKGQTPPANVSEDDLNKCICSYDGDADRIVFHSYANMSGTTDTQWYLADGDKIACLVALILKQEFVAAGILSEDGSPNETGIRFGIVQTAYANGSSSHFLRENKVPVVFAKTGVKHLHRKSEECFDVGIYFEANGHGTVIFSEAFMSLVAIWGVNSEMVVGVSPRVAMARIRISALIKVINDAIGDAISDMLAVLAILQVLNMTVDDWHRMYTDLPSKQTKMPVAKKDHIKCADDEMTVVSPAALQDALNEAMQRQGPMSRCFIRPSGTENVVRIYAEAATRSEADALAVAAADALAKFV